MVTAQLMQQTRLAGVARRPLLIRSCKSFTPGIAAQRLGRLRVAADSTAEGVQVAEAPVIPDAIDLAKNLEFAQKTASRRLQRRRQQLTYQASAIAATAGVGALAVFATYYKFVYHMAADQAFPWLDMAGTLALVVGGVVGMEMWARWAHKVLWHDFQPGWALHKSHHEPRIGPFEVRFRQNLSDCGGIGGGSSCFVAAQLCIAGLVGGAAAHFLGLRRICYSKVATPPDRLA
eukprot:GHUV01020127.1.p2 GENE.GHUV01020127.1~~GHUV01020127.1.p2  ORF type:complete len:233 (+),score=38.69 GHUV01020127.1:227-925(+)